MIKSDWFSVIFINLNFNFMKNNDFNFNSFEFEKLHSIAKNLTNILLSKAEELPLLGILDKICVSPPYFAFKKIYKYENILIAKISPEQPINDEIVAISIGEAGRHMAILGTCICAVNQKEKFYYLVKDAKITLETKNIMLPFLVQYITLKLYLILSIAVGFSQRLKVFH